MKFDKAARLRAQVMGTEALDMTKEEIVDLVEEVAEQTVENETKEIVKEIEDLSDEITEQGELVEELEEVVDGMEALIKSGNNPLALTVLYHHAENLNRKLGGSPTMPRTGMESLTPKTLEAHAIVGMESFSDTLKNAGEFGKDLVRRAVQFLMDLWNSVMSSESRIKRQANDLRRDLNSKGIKEKIKLGPWAENFPLYSSLDKSQKEEIGVSNQLHTTLLRFMKNVEDNLSNPENLTKHCSTLQRDIPFYFDKSISKLTKSGDYNLYQVPLAQGIRYWKGEINTISDATKFLNSIRILPPLKGEVKKEEVNVQMQEKDLLRYLDNHLPKILDAVKNTKSLIKGVETWGNNIARSNVAPETRQVLKAYLNVTSNVYSGSLRFAQRDAKVHLEMIKAHIA